MITIDNFLHSMSSIKPKPAEPFFPDPYYTVHYTGHCPDKKVRALLRAVIFGKC